jgi:R.Pab1 restriction endonuclease
MSSQFIRIILPLTSHSSKIRVKKRKDIFYQGLPLATRQEKITSDCYFEWQISYDLKETNRNFDKFHKTTLNKIKIVDENKQPTDRYIYELSDLLIEIIRKGFVNLNQIEKLLKEIQNEEKFIEDELEVCRTQPKEYKFGKWTFLASTIKHPLLIYEVRGLILKIEIIIKEKQKAIGIQPMLYLCIPIKLVEEYSEIENKLAETNQKVTYLITKNNFQFVIETIRIFAILSKKHQRDVVNILRTILEFRKLDKV